jgi:hypothetical protein
MTGTNLSIEDIPQSRKLRFSLFEAVNLTGN